MWAFSLTIISYGSLFLLKNHIYLLVFFPFNSLLLSSVQCLSFYLGNYFLPRCFQKFQPARLTGGFLEGEGVIYFFYVWDQGVSKVGDIVWRGLGSFFMMYQIGWKTCCFWKNGVCGRHGHRCKKGNEAKYLGGDISLIASFLDYFSFPCSLNAEVNILCY